MTKGLFRTNLEIFKYLLSVGLWEYNCEQDRALHSGPPPITHPCLQWVGHSLGELGRNLLLGQTRAQELACPRLDCQFSNQQISLCDLEQVT